MRDYSSMSQAARRLLESFDALPESDQETVAEEILRRIELVESPEDDNDPLTEEQRAEIDRRLAEYDREPAIAISWEEARTRLYRRFA